MQRSAPHQKIYEYLLSSTDLSRPFDASQYKTINAWGEHALQLNLDDVFGKILKNDQGVLEEQQGLSVVEFGKDSEYAQFIVTLLRKRLHKVTEDLTKSENIAAFLSSQDANVRNAVLAGYVFNAINKRIPKYFHHLDKLLDEKLISEPFRAQKIAEIHIIAEMLKIINDDLVANKSLSQSIEHIHAKMKQKVAIIMEKQIAARLKPAATMARYTDVERGQLAVAGIDMRAFNIMIQNYSALGEEFLFERLQRTDPISQELNACLINAWAKVAYQIEIQLSETDRLQMAVMDKIRREMVLSQEFAGLIQLTNDVQSIREKYEKPFMGFINRDLNNIAKMKTLKNIEIAMNGLIVQYPQLNLTQIKEALLQTLYTQKSLIHGRSDLKDYIDKLSQKLVQQLDQDERLEIH